jgi:uncharacterized membrane protein (TIGR02234 family)
VTEASTPPARRGFVVALVLLAAGAGLLFLAAGQPWGTASANEPGLPAIAVTLAGREAALVVPAAAVVALAGLAGLLATGRVGRIVVGVLLVLVGGAAAAAAATFPGSAADVLSRALSDRAGAPAAATTSATSWWVPALLGGLLVVVAGALAVARGGRWPRLGARYERAGAASPGAPGASPTSSADVWAALDRGEDPTL